MIEINLLPGGEKRKKRAAAGGPTRKLALPEFDRLTTFVVAAWILGPLLGLWMFFSVQTEKADVQASLDQAVADSTRYARIIATQSSLRARQDTIAQKLSIIQEIDAGRYIWPHVLDEVSRALPPYTWLSGLEQMGGGAAPTFQIEGRTGSLPALTRFMDALEASPFIRNVQLVSSEQAQLGNDASRIVNNFILTAAYEQPPLEVIETVPLFEDAAADTAAEAAAPAAGAAAAAANGSEASDGAGTT